MKKILYIDMDGVLVEFNPEVDFIDMQPMPGAIDAFHELQKYYDVYILSTAPYANPKAWTDKLNWCKHHLGEAAKKRLILTHHKNLNKGDYLIDDSADHGASGFEGEWIQFEPWKQMFNDEAIVDEWRIIVKYLKECLKK